MSIPYDFGSGRADPDTFPVEALKAAALAAIEEEGVALTRYPGGLGQPGLRRAMARREQEREGMAVDPDHIVLTNGSMQAVTLAAQTLQQAPGDPVILEAYSYPGTLAAYRNLKLRLEGIPVGAKGMCLDALEATLSRLAREGRQARFIYTISTYQNPTGTTMPQAERLRLIELAANFGVPLVEDNCYADVHYEGPVEPALYALDDSPSQIYLCSLSKILGPGLRLGYLIARPPLLERVLAQRNDAGGNLLAAAIAAKFYENGIWAHAAVTNGALRIKRDALLSGLESELSDLCCWSVPSGGLFVWVRFPDDVDRKKLLQLSHARGVTYLPGSAFHFQGADVPYLRLAFGHLSREQIEAGIGELPRCIRASRTSNAAPELDGLF